jgi:uncharacterized protein
MAYLFGLLFLICSCMAPAQAQSAAAFEVPALQGPVMDLAHIMTAQDQATLESLLRDFHQRGKGQIQVLTLPNLAGLTIEQASIQIVDRWKLGDRKRDDGVLLLVALEEKKIRIEVGQGLEGDLPDIKAKQIVSDVMAPFFRQGLPSQGVIQGALWIAKTIDPEFQSSVAPMQPRQRKASPWSQYEGLFVLIFVIFMLLGNLFRPRRRSFWGGGGGWGGGGFGGFGGGGGGGWSGGGGGFSGGGASGSW